MDKLSSVCARYLASSDTASLQDALDLSRITPTIGAIRLTDVTGKTIAISGQRREALDDAERAILPEATRQQLFRANGQWEGVAPVLQNGTPVALLWIEPNQALPVNTASIVVRICVTYGGFALLANLLPIFLVVRAMTRPLETLRSATQSIVHDPDGDTAFPLPVTTSNEAGDLTVSVNSLVLQLQERREGLLETLALLDSMLVNAPIGFGFFDRELSYVRVNDYLASTHGMPAGEHQGRRVTDFYPAELGVEKEGFLKKVFQTGVPIRNVQLSGEMPHSRGVQRSWLMHSYPVRTQDDRVQWVGVIVVEITDQLKAEEALRKSEKLAAAGRLAASIAHEINNPLESVTNLLYLLGSYEPMQPEAKQFISTAQAELARVSEITQQTLRFYRQSTLPSLANVADVLDSVLSLYRSRLESTGIAVERRYSRETEVFGFSGELRQLFANLIGNAVDAMPNGGQLRIHVHRGRQASNSCLEGVRVTIADSGTGMSEETRRGLFEAFYTTKQTTGTGLGLWVSDEIIRKHGGTVRVRTKQGVRSGTCFMVFFPDRLHRAAEPEAMATAMPIGPQPSI